MNNPDKETLLTTIQTEQETYEEKHSDFMRTNNAVILEAESALAGPKVVQQVNVPQETSAGSWRTFKPQASLKPTFLEKEPTHLEAVHFTKSFQNYILDGYAGNPPENAVWIQLQPLMNPFWMESMIHRGIKEKNLEEIMGLILEESSGRNPLNQRRIELMRVKKTGSHGDFSFNLNSI